jgi:GDP-L-fucose synthase
VKVLVAGVTGLAGSAISQAFQEKGYEVIGVSRTNLDLRNVFDTERFLKKHKPDIVIDAAAKVGGIGANQSYPVEFLVENIQIQSNLMLASFSADVPRLVFLGSSCIYPRECLQPIKEEYLMTGALESTNSAYAVAKIAGIELVNSYRGQYGRNWISLLPTNLYGPGDNFNLTSAHVMPALIRKFIEAKIANQNIVTLWGTGSSQREFMYVHDFASAVLFATENSKSFSQMNIGVGKDIQIKDLALKIAQIVGYSGEIHWDPTKPDGTPRKLLDVTRMSELGWSSSVPLDQGIRLTIAWYLEAVKQGKVRT